VPGSLALAAVAFAPGLAIGSFLNVVAARVPLKRSIVAPGSACMSCGHEVAWYDNVPVVSYLVLRGRCRGCGAGIGGVYPAVELLLGRGAALGPSMVLFARHGSAARKMAIPFAPFLAFGAIVALFFGDRLLDAYLSLL
jgi:leader peptidase (prepilin peptidase)/N-methyltransferase